jgi:hypothetical protein
MGIESDITQRAIQNLLNELVSKHEGPPFPYWTSKVDKLLKNVTTKPAVDDNMIKVWTALVPGRFDDLKTVLQYEQQNSL